MRAGLLTERVDFLSNQEINTDVGLSHKWLPHSSRWARVQYEKGRSAIGSYALTQEQSLVVTIWYDRTINESMRMSYQGGTYRLNKPLIDRKDNTMQFIATLLDDDEL